MSSSPRAESPSKQLLESLDQSLLPEASVLPSIASVLATAPSPAYAEFMSNYKSNPRLQRMRGRGKIELSSESSKQSPQSPPNISRPRRERPIETPQEDKILRPAKHARAYIDDVVTGATSSSFTSAVISIRSPRGRRRWPRQGKSSIKNTTSIDSGSIETITHRRKYDFARLPQNPQLHHLHSHTQSLHVSL